MARARLRLLLIPFALLYAALALANGLDRISESRSDIAASVPAAFRVNAARALATEALRAQHPATAQGWAETAIARDPTNAESVSLLGQAHVLAGQADAARQAFAVADRMGWRDPATQVYWMLAALERRDFAKGADRLDAVLRQAPRFEQRDTLLQLFESWPAGREQLARRLAAGPGWKRPYFADVDGLPDVSLYMRGEVARQLAGLERAPRDCALVAPLVWRMPRRLSYRDAHAVWQAYCRNAGDVGAVADAGFETASLARPTSPFDWFFTQTGDVDLMLGTSPGFAGQALEVSNTAPVRQSFATQLLQLAPGAYRATWRASAAGETPASAVTLSVQCRANLHRPLAARPVDRDKGVWAADFTVPGGCTTQYLDLAIAGGSDMVTIDDVHVAPAAN